MDSLQARHAAPHRLPVCMLIVETRHPALISSRFTGLYTCLLHPVIATEETIRTILRRHGHEEEPESQSSGQGDQVDVPQRQISATSPKRMRNRKPEQNVPVRRTKRTKPRTPAKHNPSFDLTRHDTTRHQPPPGRT